MKIIARVGLSAGSTVAATVVATAVAVVVLPASAASAAPPPDITPTKVATAALAEGHVVYLRGQNAQLYWRTVEEFTAPGYSTDWRIIPGGTVGSGPDAAEIDADSVYLAAKANDLSLLVRRQDGTTFGPWENLGGKITTAPGLVYDQPSGRLWAFARGGDGAVWYRVRAANGTWAPWASIGGIVTSAPNAIRTGEGRTLVFARGTNGAEYRRFQQADGTWQLPWEGGGRPINSALATISGGLEYDHWYRGSDRHVYRTQPPGSVDLGGTVISAPDVSPDAAVVAAVGTNRALYVWTAEEGWRYLAGIAA